MIDHIRGQLVSIETNLILPKCDKDSNSYSIQHRNSDKRKSVQLKDFPLCPGQTFILKQKIYQCEIFLKISMLIFNKKNLFLAKGLRFACVITLPSFSALTNLKRHIKGRAGLEARWVKVAPKRKRSTKGRLTLLFHNGYNIALCCYSVS